MKILIISVVCTSKEQGRAAKGLVEEAIRLCGTYGDYRKFYPKKLSGRTSSPVKYCLWNCS